MKLIDVPNIKVDEAGLVEIFLRSEVNPALNSAYQVRYCEHVDDLISMFPHKKKEFIISLDGSTIKVVSGKEIYFIDVKTIELEIM